jgi:uncharacterized protein YndB with AHSA1/START domain
MPSSTDRIEKEIVLRAPRARVWRALTDASEFGRWFGVALSSGFAVGSSTRGHITTPGYEHLKLELAVVQMEPESLLSWRWHPYAVDPAADYSQEPTTLVELTLHEVPEGTRLRVVESGFDAIPPQRRADAFRMNAQGWEIQLGNVSRHVGLG